MRRNETYTRLVEEVADSLFTAAIRLTSVEAALSLVPRINGPEVDVFGSEEYTKLEKKMMLRLMTRKSLGAFLRRGPLTIGPYENKRTLAQLARCCFTMGRIYSAFSIVIRNEDRKKKELEYLDKLMPRMTEKVFELLAYSSMTVGYWYRQIEHDFNNYLRTTKSTVAMREKKGRSKQEVIESFFRVPNIEKLTRPHTKAKAVRQYLEKYKQPSDLPSLNTIKNYLNEDKLL